MFDRGYPEVEIELAPAESLHFHPDGASTMLLDQAPPAVSDFAKLERISRWEKVIAWAQARQIGEIAGFVEGAEAAPPHGVSPVQAFESARAEVGLILTLAPGATAWRVEDAQRLVRDVPSTFAALQQGVITVVKARIVADGCTDLDAAATAWVEERVLPRAPRQTNSQLRAAVERAAKRVDKDAAEKRRERKQRERGVRLYPERDGMATLSATLPAAEAVGVYAVLDEHARRCGSADERPMDARRADALTDLVLGDTGWCSTGTQNHTPAGGATTSETTTSETPDSSGAAGDSAAHDSAAHDSAAHDSTEDDSTADDRTTGADLALPVAPAMSRLPGIAPHGGCRTVRNTVSVQIRVTVPLDTLTGAGDEPGELIGYGPITAGQARELAADPDSVWRRLVTDPLSGTLLDVGTTRYRPPPDMVEHVVSRHQYCQYPGCRVPAHRCDLDHNVPYDPEKDTGPTSTANLGPKCRPHHRLKGLRGWEVIQYDDASILWITPSGHTYLVEPPPAAEIRAALLPDDDDEPPPF